MDASLKHLLRPRASSLGLDVSVAPDPSSAVPAGAEPLLQLRALAHPGDPELQSEEFKMFLSPDTAAQVQAVLRLEEGDTALDLFYPPDAPNWGLRVENLPDTGSRFTRLSPDSLLPAGDPLDLTPGEAAALAGLMDRAEQDRRQASAEVNADGEGGG